jgi:hypothetical protein
MSSHREAPEISKDPVADNTDVYAFVSPDKTDTVTMIANFIPLEEPAGGPNFFLFGDDVLYEIKVDNNGDGIEDITYQFRFKTVFRNPNTFLYNTGPITSLDDPNWNIRQLYSVTKVTNEGGRIKSTVLDKDLITVPNRIGPRSTPNYETNLVSQAIHDLPGGAKVFTGQRDEGFYVDLGAIFDLATLRPFQGAHFIPDIFDGTTGKDDTKGYNVHTISIQVPKTHLTIDGSNPTDPTDSRSIIGVYASASRRKVTILPGEEEQDKEIQSGPFVQVSRLGEPLINEVLIPVGKKDFWNRSDPKNDSQFVQYYLHPELQILLPVLYPGKFPNLETDPSRDDLVAILLTGIPAGVVPGFPGNFTGNKKADLLRLNMAISPSYIDPNVPTDSPKRLGLLGGDIDGFPNGRRVFDDVVDIELRAIAGVTLPFVNPDYEPDATAGILADRIPEPGNELRYISTFPYLGTPNEGFEHSHD